MRRTKKAPPALWLARLIEQIDAVRDTGANLKL